MTKQGNRFISIEQDMKPLGMHILHKGMTKREAEQLADDIAELDLDVDVDVVRIPGTGQKRYERETKGHPPLARERFYTVENARYYVSVAYDGSKTLLLENRNQWGLFQIAYMPGTRLVRNPVSSVQESPGRALEKQKLEQEFLALTGITIDELFQGGTWQDEDTPEDETDEVVDSDLPIIDSDLFETALEENGYESAWDVA